MKKTLISLLGWALAVAFLVIFWQRLIGSHDQWNQILARVDWAYFGLALVVLFIGQGVLSQLGTVCHRNLGYPLSWQQSYRFWFISQIAKYIPGGIWLVATRVVLYQRNGLPLVLAGAATFWELTAMAITSLLIGLTGIGGWSDGQLALVVAVLFALLTAALVVSQQEWPWRGLARLGLRRANRMLESMAQLGQARLMLSLQLALVCLAAWIITGTGFYLLVLAFDATRTSPWWFMTSAFAAAWAIGFLVIIAPVGIGPREAVLTVLLTPLFGATIAFSIALLARVWWSLGEAVHIGVAVSWHLVMRKMQLAGE